MRRFSITVPTDVVSVCRTGAPPVTSRTFETSPTASAKSIRFELPTCTSTLLRSIVRKPVNSAFTLYAPGGSAGTVYSPASFECTTRVALVAGLVTVMVTPGTTEPLGSSTTPLISPAGAWARQGATATARITKHAGRDFMGDLRANSQVDTRLGGGYQRGSWP